MTPNIEVISDLATADLRCEILLKNPAPIGMDCEGVELGRPGGEVSLIQIADANSNVFLFDVVTCPAILTGKLKEVLEDPNILKIIHDCRGDRTNLQVQFGINLQPVFDTQIAYHIIHGGHLRIGWNRICQKFYLPRNSLKEKLTSMFTLNKKFWNTRPLTADMIEYAAADVTHLRTLHFRLNARIRSSEQEKFVEMCKNAIVTPEGASAHI